MSTADPAATVLLVDDDEDLRAMLGYVLRDAGWRVVEAGSGEEALALAHKSVPDVIVMDQRMPGLTGAELLTQLRSTGVQIPAILITAARDASAVAAAVEVECYLIKPFDLQSLLALISRALSGEC